MLMSHRGRSLAVVLGLGLTAIAAPALLAQETAAPAPKSANSGEKPAAKKAEPGRRMPNYFGQIGVTPEQKDSIYAVTVRYNAQIEELEKQIAVARAKMMEECEAVLTPTQRELLQNRRRASGASRAKVDDAKVKG